MDITAAILYGLFGIIGFSYILHLGFYLTGASMYDIWQFRRKREMNKLTPSAYKPLVTVLVPAHNEEKVVARCLDSILSSTYKRINVVVVDDASTDGTNHVLYQYFYNHPSAHLRIIRMPTNVGKGEALNYALMNFVDSELVMTLDADSVISPDSIEHAVSYFVDPKIVGVAANVQIMNQHTPLSILQKFEHMIGYRSKKAYTMTNCEFVIGGVASTYRMDTLRKVQFYDTDTLTEDIGLSMKIISGGNKEQRIVYGVDVMAMTEPVENLRALFRQRYRWKYGSIQNILKYKHLIDRVHPDYSTMLTQYRLPVAIMSEVSLFLLPLMWGYAIYLSLAEHSLSLIIGAYMTVTIYVLIILWHDEYIHTKERLIMTMYSPAAYFIFYIMDVIQIMAIIKCMFRINYLIRQKNVGSTWISPVRIGKAMTVRPTTFVQQLDTVKNNVLPVESVLEKATHE